jgi:hypothetical protein
LKTVQNLTLTLSFSQAQNLNFFCYINKGMDRTIAVIVDEKVVNPLTQRKIKTDGVLAGHLRSRGILPSEQTCYKPIGCLERRAGRNKLRW